jgi:hypothetical protein
MLRGVEALLIARTWAIEQNIILTAPSLILLFVHIHQLVTAIHWKWVVFTGAIVSIAKAWAVRCNFNLCHSLM